MYAGGTEFQKDASVVAWQALVSDRRCGVYTMRGAAFGSGDLCVCVQKQDKVSVCF